MSNALAIAGVTAVLQYYFNNLYATPDVANNFPSTVAVSCLAPDQVQNKIVGGTTDTENQVNLFMHQVTHNASWRNMDYASMSADGTQRLTSPPLALNLHYLLTVYGSDFWHAEALLGYALMMLHEAPVLTRADIRDAITVLTTMPYPYPSNKLSGYLNLSGIADQIEMIKITPESMSREEMAWLWTALKADYRPTFPFQVSVVLMQPSQATSYALPVLKRVFSPTPAPPPKIVSVQPPNGRMGALPNDIVTVTGGFLSGATRVSLTNARYGIQLTPTASQVQSGALTFTLPANPSGKYPAGVYDLEVQFMDSTNQIVLQATNTLPIAIAPDLPPSQIAMSAPSGTGTRVTISGFTPAIWEGQTVVLALSTTGATTPVISVSAQAQTFTGPPNAPIASTLSFLFAGPLPASVQLLARLLVDGVTSPVIADLNGIAPNYTPTFISPWVTL